MTALVQFLAGALLVCIISIIIIASYSRETRSCSGSCSTSGTSCGSSCGSSSGCCGSCGCGHQQEEFVPSTVTGFILAGRYSDETACHARLICLNLLEADTQADAQEQIPDDMFVQISEARNALAEQIILAMMKDGCTHEELLDPERIGVYLRNH